MHPKQAEILQYLRDYQALHGRAPTLGEIGRAVGLASRSTAHYHVNALVEAGHLERSPGWRGVRLAEEHQNPLALPLAGRIAAGHPIEAIPGQDEIDFAGMLLGPDRYVLQVRGDSMVEAGILDGDYVVMRRAESADDGDIVAALIDDEEATLKRLRQCRNGEVLLIPENSQMTALRYDAERVRIQGILVAQLRSYR
ncbi:MAG: transcriptional repressor LexA [Gammaproteobacteria bacterium]|jgi:repressor LexA